MTQLSFFGSDAAEPDVTDLAGLLVGPGQAVTRGDTARVSVVVTDDWRARALTAGFVALGLEPEQAATRGDATVVRCDFTPLLLPLVRAWHRGAVKHAPAGLSLSAGALRWWCTAAGRGTEGAGRGSAGGHLLGLGTNDEQVWEPAGSALEAAGVRGALLGPRSGGPAYRVSGRRRLARLRELVGDRPYGAPVADWPEPGA